jgi:hypothetical protein
LLPGPLSSLFQLETLDLSLFLLLIPLSLPFSISGIPSMNGFTVDYRFEQIARAQEQHQETQDIRDQGGRRRVWYPQGRHRVANAHGAVQHENGKDQRDPEHVDQGSFCGKHYVRVC